MAQRSAWEWTRESTQCCSFAPRRASVRRFAPTRPHFWAAARSLWPSWHLHTRFSQTAAGAQTHRIFWIASKKRTERSFGTESSRPSGKSSPNLRPRSKYIPVLWTHFNQGQEKLLLRNSV